MEKKKDTIDKSWKVLSEKDHKELDKAQEKFLNDNKGFFKFLKKYDAKDFYECLQKYVAQSYLVFLKNYDAKLYQKLWNSEEAIVENLKDKNPFDGMNPENLQTITEALSRSIKFKGRGGHLTKDKITLYGKVFERYDTEKKNGGKPKWSDVFCRESQRKDENGNPLISDEQDRETQKAAFLKYRKRKNINSYNDFNIYLKKILIK